MKNLLIVLLCCFSFSSFGQTNNSEAEKIIRKSAAEFSKYFVNGNWDAMIDSYTDDAKIFPDGKDILRGEEALRKYWTPADDSKYKVIYHKVTAEEIKILGKEAYDYGYYEGTTLMSDGSERSWKGKYVIVWKEVEPGVWKMYLDIWNGIND